MKLRILVFLGLLLLVSQSALALDPSPIKYKDYTIYYNVYPATHLEPAIARAAGIELDPSTLVVIVVVNKQDSIESVQAQVEANAVNVYGQLRDIDMREVKQDNRIYYVHDFKPVENEQLEFNLSVKPEGVEQPLEFEFTY